MTVNQKSIWGEFDEPKTGIFSRRNFCVSTIILDNHTFVKELNSDPTQIFEKTFATTSLSRKRLTSLVLKNITVA